MLREPWDVDPRLLELGLNRDGLLKARGVAISEARNATPNHCANAAGTFAYQHGTWALRQQFVRVVSVPLSSGPRKSPVWIVERPNNVEAIWNEALKVRVVFSNVDVACDDEQMPKPRSDKGAGAERVCVGNLFGKLPHFAPRQYAGEATYYLMVDENGACELTRVVVSGGTFSAYIERIYLSDGSDLTEDRLDLHDDGIADEFDPQIVRK